MATTTISYTATYGSKTWTGSVTSPLTVSGAASRSITTTGTTTLSCAGKVCNSNIVIGGNTLACSGKMMSSNVVINATATTYYYWNRYTIGTGYYALAQYNNVYFDGNYVNFIRAQNMRTLFTGKNGYVVSYSSYSVDSTGFHPSGGSKSFKPYYGPEDYSGAYPYLIMTGSDNGCTVRAYYNGFESYLWDGKTYNPWTGQVLFKATTSIVTPGSNLIFRSYAGTGDCIFVPGVKNVRGEFIDQVSSTSTSTYPSNGISGSYWYTYIG